MECHGKGIHATSIPTAMGEMGGDVFVSMVGGEVLSLVTPLEQVPKQTRVERIVVLNYTTLERHKTRTDDIYIYIYMHFWRLFLLRFIFYE
jgi:hypothetical protein